MGEKILFSIILIVTLICMLSSIIAAIKIILGSYKPIKFDGMHLAKSKKGSFMRCDKCNLLAHNISIEEPELSDYKMCECKTK